MKHQQTKKCKKLLVSSLEMHTNSMCSYSSGKLSIQLLDYRNAASRTYDGGCCDNIRYCVSSCDNFFILCLAGVGVTDKCSLYRRVTQVTSSDSFSFSTSLGNGLRNPVIYGFTAWQPLKFSVEVWDDDSSNFVGKDSDLIDRYTLNIQHSPSPNKRDAPEHRHSLSGRQSTMKTKVKVYCDDFYFAPNCSTYCKSRDDSTGHYTCNYTLGRKVCREGWYGKDCLVYCRPRNDSSGHYMCNEMGQKLCLDGWIGGNCTQENSSKIHPSSASSASIGSFHFSSTSNGTILSSPSFTSQHKHFFTVPILQASSTDNGPILPVSSSDNGPILRISSIPSSYNGHDWPSTSVDRNTMLSPTATVLSFLSVNSSHSTRTNHTRVASSAHSTKTTPLLGSTFTYSHRQVKVSSTMTNKIKVSASTDKALSSASKESDCGPASIANSELALTPVFMEIEMSKPVNRENVIAQVKPLILLKINEYCKMERQSCNIPTCWINSTRVLFQIKQLILEIMNKEVEYQSKMTLQLMVRLPGGNEGIVPSDILLEILNTAISDIEQSCDVHVVRIWIENTTDSSISGLLKNESPSTSDGSRALTFIAVGAGSVVVMIVVLGILYHRLRNIRSKRLKVNPLTDDDCTPPDSPDIDIADKTRLLRKQDLENLKTSSQLNEELELTSRIPGTVT